MSKLSDFRSKYGEAYNSLSDGMLAYKLWNAKYKARMPMGIFADKMDLTAEQFSEMVESAKASGYEPTVSVGTPADLDLGGTGMARSGLQGLTLGAGDEIVAGMTAGARKLGGDERGIGDIYSDELEMERRRLEQYRRTDPVAAGVTEFGSSMLTPLGIAKNAKQAFAYGTGTGAFAGAMSSEGDAGERLEAAGSGAILGGLLGPAFYKGGDLLQSQFGEFFKKRAQKAATEGGAPSLEKLRAEANQAYADAKSKGAKIDKQAFDAFVDTTIREITEGKSALGTVREKLMPATASVVNEMDRLRNELVDSIDLEDLMDLRQLAGNVAGKVTDKAESRGGMIIKNQIDDLLENLTPEQISGVSGKEVADSLKVARQVYRKMRTTESVEQIGKKATTYAGGLESGIKNQIASILRNDKKRKQYTAKELEVMQQIVEGTPVGNLVGSLSQLGLSATGGRNPFGPASGALVGGAGGFALGGPAGAVAGALMEMAGTSALRYLRERSMAEQLQILRDLVATGAIKDLQAKSPEVVRYLNAIAQRAGQGTIVSTSDKL